MAEGTAGEKIDIKAPAVTAMSKEEIGYLAYLVYGQAKDNVSNWAKWVLAPIVTVMALLGAKSYFDLEEKITGKVTEQIKRSELKTNAALDEFNKEKVQEIAKFKRQIASELDSVHAEAERTTLSFKLIAEKHPVEGVTDVKVCIYDAGNSQQLQRKLLGCDDKAGGTGASSLQSKVRSDVKSAMAFLTGTLKLGKPSGQDRIAVTIRFGKKYNNAFWNGTQLVIGDGDGQVFKTFYDSEIYAHELALWIFANFGKSIDFAGEGGALTYHFADIAAILYKQHLTGQSNSDSSWLLGSNIVVKTGNVAGLRAIDGNNSRALAGVVTSMKDYQQGMDPHVSVGIPNRAFYLVANQLKVNAWEAPWDIWREAFKALGGKVGIRDLAIATRNAAVKLHGASSPEAVAVRDAWAAVAVAL